MKSDRLSLPLKFHLKHTQWEVSPALPLALQFRKGVSSRLPLVGYQDWDIHPEHSRAPRLVVAEIPGRLPPNADRTPLVRAIASEWGQSTEMLP